MKQYKVVVEVTTTEEIVIEADGYEDAHVKAKERCKLEFHNDYYIIDIYTDDE